MSKDIFIRLFIPGGILSPGDLRKVVSSAYHFGTDSIHISSRQELLLKCEDQYKRPLEQRFSFLQYKFETEKSQKQNIVTSYPAIHLQETTNWLSEGTFHQILSNFDFQPTLKVNLIDPLQSLTPLFIGQLNFIASEYRGFWFLYLKIKNQKGYDLWPFLVESNEIPPLCKAIEQTFEKFPSASFDYLKDDILSFRKWNTIPIINQLDFPPYQLPYYEGFHQQEDLKWWLGIYNSDNSYNVNFLESLCLLCSETNNNSIYLTSNNSIIIKNIERKDIFEWEKLLGKYKINTGHSSLELNWQIPDLDKEATKLKKFITRSFIKEGLRTNGLIFGIRTTDVDLACSVIIRRKFRIEIGKIKLLDYYNISYKKNFDINSRETVSYANYVKKRDVPTVLTYLTEVFYKKLNSINTQFESDFLQEDIEINQRTQEEVELFQCESCLTIYDSRYGDDIGEIPAGRPFEELPSSYRCPVCDSEKESFKSVNSEILL
jgi:rubredoxin